MKAGERDRTARGARAPSGIASWSSVRLGHAATAAPRAGLAVIVVVVAAAVLSHATALAGGFIWLDHAHIEGALGIVPLGEAGDLFRRGFAGTGFYRPLMALSLSVDAALGGGPLLFHAVTLGWHAAAAAMVVVAGSCLGVGPVAAFLAGLLFAVHPATSLVANAIAFRSEAMMTVMLLALIVFHVRGRPFLTGAMLLAGALTKETALVLGPLFVLALSARTGMMARSTRETAQPGRDTSPHQVWLVEIVALIVAVGLRLAFAPTWRAHFPPLSPGEAVGTRLAVLTRAVQLWFVPLDLSACDAFPVTSVWQGRALAGGALMMALAVAIWRLRHPVVRFLLLLLTLSVLPALHAVPIARWWSPHCFYLPLAFAALAGAEAIARYGTRSRHGRAVLALALVLLIVVGGGAMSLAEGRRYRSDAQFWGAERAQHPECREAEFYLAEGAREAGQLEVAARHYEAALTPTAGVLSYVDARAALQNLGATRLAAGHFPEAEEAFASALALTTHDRERRELTHNMAAAALAAGRAAEALELLKSEVARPDAFPQSMALHALGRDAEAAAAAQRLRLLRGVSGAALP